MLEPSSSEEEDELQPPVDINTQRSASICGAFVQGGDHGSGGIRSDLLSASPSHVAFGERSASLTPSLGGGGTYASSQPGSSLSPVPPRSASPAVAYASTSSAALSGQTSGSPTDRLLLPGSAATGLGSSRPSSPTPSIRSTGTGGTGARGDGDAAATPEMDEAERQEREEQERKQRLQLYVFVLRCIAYPFNAKQPTDMTRRQLKVTKSQLESIVLRFASFLKGETQIAADEAFINAIQNYYQVFLK